MLPAGLRSALAPFVSGWVLVALAADAGLAIADASTGTNVVLTVAYLVPVLAVALVENGERTAVVAAVSSLLALISGEWGHDFSTTGHFIRFGVVGGSSLLAVAAAVLRTRAMVARDRMELLGQIAQISDARLPLDESLCRVADVFVPAMADFCEIAVIEDNHVRRLATRIAAGTADLERRLRERPAAKRTLPLTRSDERLAEAQLVRRMVSAHVAALATDEEHRELLDGLRLRSAIYAPMRAGEDTLAALTLAVGLSGRRYGTGDLRFAQTAASRAALAIDNARLFLEAQEAEQRMQAIVGSLADAVTIRDLGGQIVYANDAALRSMGFTSVTEIRERAPQSIWDEYIVTSEDGSPLVMDEIPSVRLLHGDEPEPLMMRCIHRERGVERWLLLKATPLYDVHGKIEAAVTVIEDVTTTKRAELQTRFLAQASDVLASSLDYEETLRNVAWLVVPEFADWCAVELLTERGERQEVIAAHRDPEKVALAQRLRAYNPPRPDPNEGLGRVLATGEPQLYPDIPDELLKAGARDREHLHLLRRVGMRSALIVPMRIGRRIIGAMSLVSAESGRRFTEDDVNFVEQIAARAAVAVENARLYTERSQIAETLQHSLLPQALPEIDGWELASLYRPASFGGEVEVGGDFYDGFRTENGWLMLIGDVTGKGVEVAAMTSLVRHGARFISDTQTAPTQILARLDAALRQQDALTLCSVLCMQIDGDHVCFASAGHPLPLVVTDDGVRSVGQTGPVLGAFDDSEWPSEEFVLRPNEVLLLYTDGVTDTIGAEGRFGDQRLHQTMAECGPLAAEELLACLDKALSDFQVGAQADDTAALALRLVSRPAPAAQGMREQDAS